MASLPDLWPHQRRGIEQARAAMRQGHSRVVVVVPTGGGKTRLGVEVVRSAVAKGGRVVWLAHRAELIGQAFDTLLRAGLHVGAVCASSDRPADPSAPVQVASIQTLLARSIRPEASLIVCDECQHLAESAEYWASLLDAYPMVHVLGLTATPERGDGTGLAPIFTALVQVVSVRELTELGVLVPCEIDRPASYLKQRGDSGNKLAQDPVDRYCDVGGGGQAFLFAATVEEAEGFAARLSERGHVARCIGAKTPKDERAAVIDGFKAGRVRVITNVYVMTEGVDLPAASVCVLARGCASAGTFLQMVGRVLRSAPGKTSALLIDLPGVTHLHGPPEDDRIWALTGRACIRAGQVCRVCAKPIVEYPCSHCGFAPDLGAEASISTEIMNVPMEKFARMIAQSPEQRRETLDRWVRLALAKGQNPRTVLHRWRAVYKEECPRDWWSEAVRRQAQTVRPS